MWNLANDQYFVTTDKALVNKNCSIIFMVIVTTWSRPENTTELDLTFHCYFKDEKVNESFGKEICPYSNILSKAKYVFHIEKNSLSSIRKYRF